MLQKAVSTVGWYIHIFPATNEGYCIVLDQLTWSPWGYGSEVVAIVVIAGI